MMVGAIQAMKEAGLKPGKDILTVSIDAVPDIFKAMVAGEANATVELTPNMAGPALDAVVGIQGEGHRAAEVDPDRIQALRLPTIRRRNTRARRASVTEAGACRTAHCGSATAFASAVRTNRLGVRSISGRPWE